MYNELKNQIITGLLSSPVIYIPHFHYELVDEVITEILSPKSGRKILEMGIDDICEFDIKLGIIDFVTKCPDRDWSIKLEALLEGVVSGKRNSVNDKKVFLIKNADKILCSEEVQALLQLFAQKYERGFYKNPYSIILVSSESSFTLPLGIEKIVSIVDVLAPTEVEISEYISSLHLEVSKNYSEQQKSWVLKNYIRTLQGLQMYEIKQIINSSTLRTGGCISEKTISIALEEKKNIVKKSGIIEVVNTDVTFDEVGGLENLKNDLKDKAKIYRHLSLAADLKIPLPKGILIIGMPGCGKSMIAKSIAEKFGVSLLRLDVNRLMGQYVGQSEHNLRRALETAEAAHPCVLWIDEIEKAFAGSSGQGDSDMLVMRLMGHFLTWMQERKTAVYIVATANDVMRPEFMRKGRFDEVYFVDFPTTDERVDILKKKIHRYDVDGSVFDFSELKSNGAYKNEVLEEISKAMAANGANVGGFSGAEIESVVNMLVESKFIEYINSMESGKEVTSIKIGKEDFIEKATLIKEAAMCNQKGIKQERTDREKTNIERIREVQAVYKFRSASKTSKQ
ncbi:MAG: AAA family ATPase [Bacteroidaceae bacterium]|nr:AAA family ATPase [Bacteroidaceae bacterium]